MGNNSKDILAKNLMRLMETYNMTREELSQKIDVPYSTISNWLQGISYPRAQMLDKLSAYFDVATSELVDRYKEDTPSYRMYPVLGEVQNGYDSFAVQDVIGEEAIPEEWIKGDDPDNYFVLAVKGESNYPELRPGSDRLLIHKTSSVDSGSLALVLYESEYATVKRVIYKKGEDWLELQPLNPSFPPLRIEGSDLGKCKVIGEVVRLIRKY